MQNRASTTISSTTRVCGFFAGLTGLLAACGQTPVAPIPYISEPPILKAPSRPKAPLTHPNVHQRSLVVPEAPDTSLADHEKTVNREHAKETVKKKLNDLQGQVRELREAIEGVPPSTTR